MSTANQKPEPDYLPGTLDHLVRRFFDVLSAKPLSESERLAVKSWLPSRFTEIFFEQDDHDQRHGYHAAQSVVTDGFDGEVVVAALMHDVGKRHSRLGILGRSLASLMILLHLPLTRRMAAYRDHGTVAADELELLDASSLVVDFARHHHAPRPETIELGVWEALQLADQPPKAKW